MQQPSAAVFDVLPEERFTLDRDFVQPFAAIPPPFGPLGEVTYRRTYSRQKPDGANEEWWETVQRVVNGTYTVQKRHCLRTHLPWSDAKAQGSAQEMYRLIFSMRFLPPGRGLWMMGTPYLERAGGAALNNCGFVSTAFIDQDFAEPFCFLMDFSMLGVGIGGDTAGAGTVKIFKPQTSTDVHVVEDSREGWVTLVRRILNCYVHRATAPLKIDYSLVRRGGTPIKGFGGVASGPEPLMDLVQGICDTLGRRIGQAITSEDIVDLFDRIGKCVVAGNVRRSAIIMLGDKDDLLFAELKDPTKHADALMSHRWASNNSIIASVGMDYSTHAANTATNGEPGYFWLDNARAYGRMADPPNHADRLVAGTNPCSFAGETIVHTINGPRRIDSLKNRPFWALVNGKPHYSPQGSWITGRDDIFRLTTIEGFTVNVTNTHKIMTPDGWKEAGQLVSGDTIVLHDHGDAISWEGNGTYAEGYLIGLLIGDGHYESGRPVLNIWLSDPGHNTIHEAALACAHTIPHRSDWKGWRDHGRGVLAMSVGRFPEQYGLSRTQKHITEQIELGSSDFQRGVLQGLFDADGHVEGNADSQTNWSVRLGQSHYADLRAVQRMLLRFGIFSKIYQAKSAGTAQLPDGNGSTKAYPTKDAWRLVISANNVQRFAERIGFHHGEKRAKLEAAIRNSNFYQKPFHATVKNLIFERHDDVWDLTVTDVHAFDANGLYVSNSEQSLEHYELCNLVETFPSRHDTYEEYQRTLKFAYLYAKTVTLIPTHNPHVNAVTMRNRRIGCSMTGIIDAFVKHGKREFVQWMDSGYRYLRHLDEVYSDWLCVPRSRKITSVKPSGTVSLLPGVSPGIHYPHAEYYWRTIRIAATSPMIPALQAAGYRIEPSVTDPKTLVVYFPVRERHFDRAKSDVSMWEQLENAAMVQAHWADNQVSITVTFHAHEAKDIRHALEFYESRLKSVSFLPLVDHQYAQAPYQAIGKDEYDRAIALISPVDWHLTEHDSLDVMCDGDTCLLPQ